MIITRTPYRISFFGGGTDFEGWYKDNGGALLSTTINRYIYVIARYIYPFFQHKSRVVWRKIEEVKNHKEIENPIVRASLEYLRVERGVEVHYQGDMPSRSGIGSSSTFAVGVLSALYGMMGQYVSKRTLAQDAIYIERKILKEQGGIQDQIAASFGGLNHIKINNDGNFQVDPLTLLNNRKKELESSLLLFFTGISRNSYSILKNQDKTLEQQRKELSELYLMVEEAKKILVSSGDINDFGKLLDEAWSLKKGLSSNVSSSYIDEIYNKGKNAGALGGKVLGAGGGGFMIFFVPPNKKENVKRALNDLLCVDFEFEDNGAQTIFYAPENQNNNTTDT